MDDGKQGISHDRVLMRIKDYLQILTTVVGIIWGGIKIVQKFDEVNQKMEQIPILQRQVSVLEQLIVNARK